MSKIVNPEDYFGTQPARGKLINWRRWCDGESHELKRGVDLPAGVSMHSKRSSFRQWVDRQPGVTKEFMHTNVHTRVPDEETLVIWVQGGLPRMPEAGSPEAARRERLAAERSEARSDDEVISRRRGRMSRS